MKLKEYLTEHGIMIKSFAKKLNIGQQTLINYLYGKRVPPLPTASKIIEMTQGEVTLQDLLDTWDKSPKK